MSEALERRPISKGLVSKELPPTSKEILPNERKPHTFFFISGLGATAKGVGAIEQTLKSTGVAEDIEAIVWNSVYSPDKRTPKRFQKMAEQTIEQLEAGRKVVFVAHSGGAGELAAVFGKIKKQRPDLLNEANLSDIECILIGPAGLWKGIRGAVKTVQRLAKLQASQLGLILAGRFPTTTAGIESLYILPSQDTDQDKLTQDLREMFPKLSNYREAVDSISYKEDERHWNMATRDQKSDTSEIDRDLLQTISANDKKGAKKLLKKRAKVLNFAAQRSYDGIREEEVEGWEPLKIPAVSYLGLASLLGKLVVGGARKVFKKLEKSGLRLHYVVPEYDAFVILKDIQKTYRRPIEEIVREINIVGMDRATHTSWAPFSEQLGRAVSQVLTP